MDKIDNAELTAQILQILRENSEAVLEIVEVATKKRQERIEKKQQEFLDRIIAEPGSVIGDSPTAGSSEQKIVLLEFSDFQCPSCAQARETVKEFMDKNQDSVTWVYKYLPLTSIHPQALPAAKAAWAAGRQDKLWEYHDALFNNQDKLGENLYIEIAENLNLDLEQFDRDRQSDAAIQAIEQDINLADSVGINSTPFILLNGKTFSGEIELSQMEEVL